MPIIQFILPSRNKALKKLLHTYWEVCPKYDENGKLKQEMILVVNAIRNDLVRPQSPGSNLLSSVETDRRFLESPKRIHSRRDITIRSEIEGRRAPRAVNTSCPVLLGASKHLHHAQYIYAMLNLSIGFNRNIAIHMCARTQSSPSSQSTPTSNRSYPMHLNSSQSSSPP